MKHSLPRRILWKLADRLGGAARRWSWDDQHARGRWDYLEHQSPTLVRLVAEHSRGADVLEMGCWCGALAREVYLEQTRTSPETYSAWFGLDVSSQAIAKARGMAAGLGIPAVFISRDLSTPDLLSARGLFGVVVASEVLYYLTPARQEEVLREIFERLLVPTGVFICILHDPDKHAAVIERVIKIGGAPLLAFTNSKRYYSVTRRDAP